MAHNDPDHGAPRVPAHRRRPRYSGTHPRRFEHRYKELALAAYPDMYDHVCSQGRTPAGAHLPVLVNEVLEALRPQPGDIVADCTLGYGGHAMELMRRIVPGGRLIGIDLDDAEIRRTEPRIREFAERLHGEAETPCGLLSIGVHRCHFAGLPKVLAREGLDGCNVILADLGVSSMQIDDPRRGFSYKHDGPLDMRMDDRLPRTASDLLATLSVTDLAACLAEFADEPDAERVAARVVRDGAAEPITTTRQLVRCVLAAKGLTPGEWRKKNRGQERQLHPAARTFQALRMLVNDEIAGLSQFLRVAPYCLRPGGRIGVVSFHSGEDRLVREAFAKGYATGVFVAISEGPTGPSSGEVVANPRCRSARLRWAVRSSE